MAGKLGEVKRTTHIHAKAQWGKMIGGMGGLNAEAEAFAHSIDLYLP